MHIFPLLIKQIREAKVLRSFWPVLILTFLLPGIAFSQGVGINTTTPKSMLDVEGNVAIGATYSGTTAAPADGVIIEGKVGIGTSSPVVPLHIATGSASAGLGWVPWAGTQLLLQLDDATDQEGLVLSLVGKNAGTAQINFGDRDAQFRGRIIYDNGKNYTDAMLFYTNNTTWMMLESGGRLGLADDEPDARLEISADAGADDYFMLSSNDGNDGDIMIAKNSGFVGIGTSAPSTFLEIAGALGATGGLHLNSSTGVAIVLDRGGTGNNTNLQFATAGAVEWQVGQISGQGAAEDISFYDLSTTSSALQVEYGTGSVGIGSNAPAALLDITNSASSSESLIRVRGTTTDFGIDHSPTMTPSSNKQSIRNVPNWDPQVAGLTLHGLNTNNLVGGSGSNGVGNMYMFHAQMQTQEAYGGTISNLMAFRATGWASNTSSGSPSVTNYFAFHAIDPAVDASSINAGFYGQMTSGAGKYNLYMTGDATNYLAGNTGIGTSSPDDLLHIYGDQGSGVQATIRLTHSDATTDWWRVGLNNGENFVINYNGDVNAEVIVETDGDVDIPVGDVAIGTTDQVGRLNVVDSDFPVANINRSTATTDKQQGTARLLHTTSADMVDGFGASLLFAIEDNASVVNLIGSLGAVRAGADNTGDFVFSPYSTGTATERMRITNDGNVGINTASPSAELEVVPTDGSDTGPWTLIKGGWSVTENSALRLYDAGSATNNIIKLEFAHADGDPGPTVQAVTARIKSRNVGAHAANGSNLILETTSDDGSTWNSDQLFLENSGNVGIGSNNPAYALDVVGDINVSGTIRKAGGDQHPDYVFEPDYKILNLDELKLFLEKEKHLPGFPSAEDVKKDGVDLYEHNRLTLEKLEEAYLYILQLNQQLGEQQDQLNEQQKINEDLYHQIKMLKK